MLLLGNCYICGISMAARANSTNLFCFTWVVSFFTELLLSVEQNINLDQNTLTSLFCFTWVASSLLSCCYLSSRMLNNPTLICG